MSLSSHQIDAFMEVARVRSFSQAASNLNITQSALSQRIINLEEELGSSLLVREPSGVRLTDVGQEFLRYGQIKSGLENEFLEKLKNKDTSTLGGLIRVGGFSSVMRSVVMPSLKDLVQENPTLQIEIVIQEMREMPRLLQSGVVDYVIADREIPRKGLKSHFLGYEENVLVELKTGGVPEDIFLDHDLEDETTELFFRLQKSRPKKLHRSFLQDVYGIIEGVTLGWGRAVVPLHLVKGNPKIRIVKDYKSLKIPLILHYYEHPFYPKLHGKIVEALTTFVPRHL